MNKYGLSFHHLGLATKRFESATIFLKGLQYHIPKLVYDKEQNVNLALCTHAKQPDIELICEPDNSRHHPLVGILENRDSMLYHTCYFSNNPDESILKMKDDGLRLSIISKPKPAILFSNRLVSFYYVRGFGLLEVIDTNE